MNETSNDSSDDEESSDFYEVEWIERHRANEIVLVLQFLIIKILFFIRSLIFMP